MPRVYSQKAGRDYPKQGIKKGTIYYQWAFFRGPTIRSATRPRASQLTQSEPKSAAYVATEILEDGLKGDNLTPEDVKQALDDAKTAMEEAVTLFEDSISNMEESFPNGNPTIEEFNEWRDACETYASECESAMRDIDGIEGVDQYDHFNEVKQGEIMEEVMSIAEGVQFSM